MLSFGPFGSVYLAEFAARPVSDHARNEIPGFLPTKVNAPEATQTRKQSLLFVSAFGARA